MNSDNFTNIYYDIVCGEFPTKENYEKTDKIFQYLMDCNLQDQEILKVILENFDNKEYITSEDIPEHLWDNSLIKRNVFYFHKELQIVCPPPTWDEEFKFYLEMKIRYTEKDLLDYFSKAFKIRKDWISTEKEIGSIKYLLNKYSKFDFIEPIDFLLNLIDYVSSLEVKCTQIYDLGSYELDFAKDFEPNIINTKLSKKNIVVWR